MDSALLRTHASLAGLLGSDAEPPEVLRAVERHRQFWRPTITRVVLLAESHVYTAASELDHQLRAVAGLPENLPRGFVRLVYALGYGEDSLLNLPIPSPPNRGTPQFWKVFQSCVTPAGREVDCSPIQVSRTPSAHSRLAAKLRLLALLRERGVWLVDASVAALYVPGGSKPEPRIREAAIQASWDGYTAAAILTAKPEAILCIGVGVARALRARLNRLGIAWATVHQPQAHLSADEHRSILRTYSAICADPRTIRSIAPVA